MAGMPVCAAMLGAFLGQITWEGIAERLISTAVMGLLIAGITIAVMKQQLNALAERFGELNGRLGKIDERLVKDEAITAVQGRERVQCELRGAQTYATRAEIARLIAEQTAQDARTGEKLDQIHGRITELAKQVAELRGQRGGEAES